MRLLGIDPGTRRCGFGIVDSAGSTVRAVTFGLLDPGPDTATGEGAGSLLLSLHRHLAALLAEHRPERVAVEKLFFNKNVRTALAVGEARGVVLMTAAQAGLPVDELSPQEVKISLTGYGAADKTQVGKMVARVLGLASVPRPDDVADALAVAIAGSARARLAHPSSPGRTP